VRCGEELGGNGVLRESFVVEVEAAEEEAVEKTNRVVVVVVRRPRRAVSEGGGEGRERELRGDERGLRRRGGLREGRWLRTRFRPNATEQSHGNAIQARG